MDERDLGPRKVRRPSTSPGRRTPTGSACCMPHRSVRPRKISDRKHVTCSCSTSPRASGWKSSNTLPAARLKFAHLLLLTATPRLDDKRFLTRLLEIVEPDHVESRTGRRGSPRRSRGTLRA